MKRSVVTLIALLNAPLLFAGGANGPWGTSQVSVGVAIQQGTAISAWNTPGRADQTNGIQWCTSVGDGTYQIRVDLVPTGVYNYIFFASATAVNPLFTQAAEPVPNSGSDAGTFLSLSTVTINQPSDGSVGYASVQGDGRRLLKMPDVNPGTTVYVYNSFASTPTGVANYTAQALSSSSALLQWQGGLGYWGNSAPSYATLGGNYMLFRATSSQGPYTLQATLSGITTTYTDTGLTLGVTNYYIFVSSDSYSGPTNPANVAMFANLRRLGLGAAPGPNDFDPNQYTHNDKTVKTVTPVMTIFRVENIDEDYVNKNGKLVYLTPWGEDGRFYPAKLVGTFHSIRIVKIKEYGKLAKWFRGIFRLNSDTIYGIAETQTQTAKKSKPQNPPRPITVAWVRNEG